MRRHDGHRKRHSAGKRIRTYRQMPFATKVTWSKPSSRVSTQELKEIFDNATDAFIENRHVEYHKKRLAYGARIAKRKGL